ncbi:hypothetical protein C8R47DRAFT_761190 [Mycena vitilis]|nr:hypothetical protein C8R47DRAFT_761190 [Mycena vitilis]
MMRTGESFRWLYFLHALVFLIITHFFSRSLSTHLPEAQCDSVHVSRCPPRLTVVLKSPFLLEKLLYVRGIMQKSNDPAAAAATRSQRLSNFRRYCGETHRTDPIPEVERVDTRNYQLFLLCFSANMNIPTLVVGAAGPVVFKLSFPNTAINFLITVLVALFLPISMSLRWRGRGRY